MPVAADDLFSEIADQGHTTTVGQRATGGAEWGRGYRGGTGEAACTWSP